MIILYGIIAIYIAWIWVDYYRLIDIYEKESLKYFILTFLLGCSSVLIVIGLNRYLNDSTFQLNGDFINDFVYCVFKIGVIEEFAKTVPFIIIYLLFKNQFNEPIDYLVFICISALGFSAAENIKYFYNHGPYIINSRAILSTVGHMFDTSLVAYGIIRYRYRNTPITEILLYFFLAALSHGFYDFWLIYDGVSSFGWLITILYFLITISVFAVILNNALNNSTFFTYKKVIDSNKVASRLLTYYSFVFLIQFVLLVYFENITYALHNFFGSLYITGFIVVVATVRLSRFKLIKDKWESVKIELPFSIYTGDSMMNSGSTFVNLRIKGEGYNEAYMNIYYQEYFYLHPVSQRNSYLGSIRLAYIDHKFYLKNDEIFYSVRIFQDENNDAHELMLLQPKTFATTMVEDKYPIVGLIKIEKLEDFTIENLSSKDFKFKEWAFLKPKIPIA